MIKKNTKPLHWRLPTYLHGNLKISWNNKVFEFALRYDTDIEHLVIYHLKDVCKMCRRSLNHFSWVNTVPCGMVVDVNVSFDTWIAWQRKMFGWLFLRKNGSDLFIIHVYLSSSLSFKVPRSFGNSNWNLAFMTSNFGLGLRSFEGTTAQSLRL